jgi:ATP-binding cassette subfamily F protein uup
MSFKEQQEWQGIEAAILAPDEKVVALEARLVSPELLKSGGAAIKDAMKELEGAKAEAARLYSRWEILDALRQAGG